MLSFCVILETVLYFLLFIRREYLLYSILIVLCLVSWNFILRIHVLLITLNAYYFFI